MVNIVIHDLCESTTLDSETMCSVSGGIAVGEPHDLPGGSLPKLPFPIGDYLPKLPFPYPIGGGGSVAPVEPFDPALLQ